MKKLLPVLLLSILFLSPFSSAGGNFIIIRANVNPMYIEGESIFIQAFILVFRNNKPTDESATLHVEIAGKNVEYSYSEDFTIPGGRRESYYLPALAEGHYRITIFAQKGGLSSQKMVFEFGVSKAPIPYDAKFSPDGSKFHFKSLKVNETGVPDPDFPFTLKIYSMTHGGGETLIRTIKNVTEITVSIPSSVRRAGGIAIVDIIDCYGWKNSATMDLSSFSFTGIPAQFDYGYMFREPFRSRQWIYILVSAIIFLFIVFFIFIAMRWWHG